jgi:L-fuculose-phosphate aldolase
LFVPPEVPRFTRTGDLIVSAELGADLAETLGERDAALMVNHGIVTCGGDVTTGVMRAVLLERACRTNLRAIAGGGPTLWSSDEEALAKREHCWSPQLLRQAWDYLARRAER